MILRSNAPSNPCFPAIAEGCVDRRELEISGSHREKVGASIPLAGQADLQDLWLRTVHSTQHGHSPTVQEFTVAGIEHRFIACLPECIYGKLVRSRERLLESDDVRLSPC